MCTSNATHRVLLTSNMCVMRSGGTAQLLSLKELKSHVSLQYFIRRNHKSMKEGKKPEKDNNNNRIQRRYSRFFFYNLLTAPRTVSNTHAQVARARATHRALITWKCHVTCHLVRRDSSAIKFDSVEIAFI